MNISDAARELLPCPFCGGEAEVIDMDPHGTSPVEARAVVCRKCQASSPNMHCSNTAGAIRNASQAWNTRDTTATAALTLELETVKRENEKLLSRAGKLVAKALQLAQERDQLRQQLAEAREDSAEDKPLPEDEAIEAAHPINSGLHDLYGEAMRLVGAKHTKAALVALVNWLLTERMERDRTIKRLSRPLNPPTDEK